MYSNTKNFKHGDYEEAIKICDRLLESPYLKDNFLRKCKYSKKLQVIGVIHCE